MLLVAEYVLLVANTILLLLEGASDKKIRGIPHWLVILHAVLALVSMAIRFSYLDIAKFTIVYAITGFLVAVLVLVWYLTGLIGEGDVTVIALSSATTPYIPVGYLSGVPITAPLAILASATYLTYKYIKTTRVVYLKGAGKVRARVRYVADFKHGLLGSEVPIYVDGYGVLPLEARKNPSYMRKLLASMPDYAIVYSVPNYPYVYYYSVSFIFTCFALFMVSLMLYIVVI